MALDEPAVPGGDGVTPSHLDLPDLVLPGLWAVAVVAVGARLRPAPARVRALGPLQRAGGQPGRADGGRLAATATAVVERLGAWVLRRAGRPPAPATARRLGAAVVAAGVVVPFVPLAAPPVALVVWFAPAARARSITRHRSSSNWGACRLT